MRLKARRGTLKHTPLEFAQFTDFLRVDDARFLVWAAEENGLEELVQDINNRNLSKRCLVLCRQSVHKSTLQEFLKLLPPSQKNSSIYSSIEQEIYDTISPEFQAGRDMLMLDFPKFPDADEEAGAIFLQEGRDVEPEALKGLLPTADWLRSYAVNKYRAHLFYVSDDNKRLAAAQAAEDVLLKRGIKLLPSARQFANI